jgi:hypothetical protein
MTIKPRRATCTGMFLSVVLGAVLPTDVHAQDSWDAIYLAGSKIGWVHTFVEKVHNNGKNYLRVRIDCEQRLKRDKDVSLARFQYGTIETADGQVLRLDTLTAVGEQKLRGHGDVIRGQMNFILEGTGQRQELLIPWGPEVRGPYAAEQSMARTPMKEQEARALKMFMPTLNKICDIALQARALEPVIMGDGTSRPLLKVEQTTKIDGQPKPEFDITLWVDTEGQVLKQEQDLLGGYIQYRTTKKAALSPGGPVQFDLTVGTAIKVASRITNPEKTRQAKYRITVKDGDPAKIIPSDSRQTITPDGNGKSAILEVKSGGPLDGQSGSADVDPRYSSSNALVTSSDSRVQRFAEQATRGVVDPWEKSLRIASWVHKNITDKNFTVGFAAASEVARNLSGDCTEHAVLTAAMCRAAGIPANVVIGLVYEAEHLRGFGYHMWNEVYVNHRWVAVDSSWDQSAVDAVHIKLTESSLDGVSPFEAFLPVVRVMGKMEIEPLEVR